MAGLKAPAVQPAAQDAHRDLRVHVSRLKMGFLKRVDPKYRNSTQEQRTGPHEQRTPLRTRLQAIVSPSSMSLAHTPNMSVHVPLSPVQSAPPFVTVIPPDLPAVPTPRFLKVRIVTWNMHESLPKGDLSELLGRPPPFKPQHGPMADHIRIPNLTLESDHPYHIVVIAGQECPTLSGMPRGLGAFKLQDKERELREREKEAKREAKRKAKRLQHPHLDSQDEDEDSDGDADASGHGLSHANSKDSHHHPPGGWTSIVEDWLSGGVGAMPGARLALSDADIVSSASTPVTSPRLSPVPGVEGQDHNIWNVPDNAEKRPREKGAYELLTKERLMGLYIAVYIHRDVRPLIKGVSKSSVTAGLIGGRVGNKGGVGVSMNVNGTTLLFVNMHLAAHSDKANLRLANLQKIKSELTVETFLRPDDPRNLSEEISERFDHTFMFGDLNYRLDISRLHADWLISRQDYATALKFDQLRKEMQDGTAFVGFQEGEIDFPPTFKYDVLKTLKGSKSKKGRKPSGKRKRRNAGDHAILEETDHRDEGEDDEVKRDGSETEPDTEAGSSYYQSSVWTQQSGPSRTHLPTTDGEDSDFDTVSPMTLSSAASHHQPLSAVQSLQMFQAAHKVAHRAKRKVVDMIAAPGSPMRARMSMRERFGHRQEIYGTHVESDPSVSRSKSLQVPKISGTSLGSDSSLSRAAQQQRKGSGSSEDSVEAVPDGDRGVYDSSHKRRVPSWCDRILWKSSPLPDPEPEPLVEHHKRSNFVEIFMKLGRHGKDSLTSLSSGEASQTVVSESRPTSIVRNDDLPSSSSSSVDDSHRQQAPFTRFFQRHVSDKRVLAISQSMDDTSTAKPVSRLRTMSASHERPNRQISLPILSQTSSQQHTSPIRPARAGTDPITPHDAHHVKARSVTSPVLGHGSKPASPTISDSAQPRRWYRFTKDQSSSPLPLAEEPQAPPAAPPAQAHRKGDVVCISYASLDDRQMRRLEGRSDHRPVIGQYAIFL